MKKLFILLACVLLVGCTTSSIMDNAPKDEVCVICKISEQLSEIRGEPVTPEGLFAIIKLANVATLENDPESAEKLYNFVHEAIVVLEATDVLSMSYMDIILYVSSRYSLLSPKLQAALLIAAPEELRTAEVVFTPISQYDRDVILRLLRELLVIIQIYSG